MAARTTARQWRHAAIGLRDQARLFEERAQALEESAEQAPVVEVTPEAEALIRSKGKRMQISTNASGLQLDMLDASETPDV